MYSKITPSLYIFFTGLISFMSWVLHRFRIASDTPDLAITLPSNIRSLSYFSPLKRRTLRQTEERWCWFDQARKDDQEMGTRLGTLRFLPYEVREQIFKIVLDDYFDEFSQRRKRYDFTWLGRRRSKYGALSKLKLRLNIEGVHCCCAHDKKPEVRDIFDLASYDSNPQGLGRAPLNLLFASPSIRPEFARIFLSSCTFEFNCSVTLERFLDWLSPTQQKQLSRLRLLTLQYGDWYPKPHDRWMTVCQRLPSRLKSVIFIMPIELKHIPGIWRSVMSWDILDEAEEMGHAAEILEELCMKVSRAAPRAVISLTRRGKVFKDERDFLDGVLRKIEPWSKDWLAWIDETDGVE